jgi:hypothetical protein
MQKSLFFFICSHFKTSQRVLIKGLKPFPQDQKAKNSFLPSKSSKTTKILKTKTIIAKPT